MITCDAHVDTPWIRYKKGTLDLTQKGQGWLLDFPRMKEGGLDSAFFAIYLSDGIQDKLGVSGTDKAIDKMIGDIEAQSGSRIVTNKFDAEVAVKDGLVPIFLGLEGGRLINASTDRLSELRKKGIRYLTLTHNRNTEWADSATDIERHGGITKDGLKLLKHAEGIGVLVDVSHASDKSTQAAIDNAAKPVVATHSGCRALWQHPRNLPDDLIKAIVGTKGIVCVPFAFNFIGKLWDVADHIDHIVQLTGNADSVGIGSDIDGAEMVDELKDASDWKVVVNEALDKKGYSTADIAKIAGENLLRLLEA